MKTLVRCCCHAVMQSFPGTRRSYLEVECWYCLNSGIRVREYVTRGQLLLETWNAEMNESIRRIGRELDKIRMRAFTDSKPKHAPRARKR